MIFLRIFCIFFCLFFLKASLQAQSGWEQAYEAFVADAADEESASWQHLYEDLAELHARPLNINMATREQLEAYPFLSHRQVEELLAYLYTNGPMETLSELMLVEGFDYSVRNLSQYFFYVGKVEQDKGFEWDKVLKYGHHEAIARLDIPLYERAGYGHFPDSVLSRYPNRRYLGEPFYHSVRYNFNYADRIQAGFVVEKDAGEAFLAKGFNGYDYGAFYLMLADFGCLKRLVAGDYRLRFGQGLVMNTDFNPGKLAMLSSLGIGRQGIKKHSSTSEYNAFRGLAATWRLWKLEATAFFSRRHHDATLVENRFITTLKTDGLHRTPSEYLAKGNVVNSLYGGNLAFASGPFRTGLTAVYNFFSHPLITGDAAYRRYYPQGRTFATVGADYAYFSHGLTVVGETAVSRGGGWGTINKMQLRLWDDYLLTLVQRYYSRDFHSLYGNSFSENSTLRNESGLYLGVDATAWHKWALAAYVDFCYFPWLKYQVSSSSYGGEGMLRAVYTWNDRHKSTIRYRIKLKEADYTALDKRKYLATRVHHRMRYQHDYSPNRLITFSSLVDFNMLRFMENTSCGGMFTERVSWKPQLPISLYASACYFLTDNFDTRVTAYERGLLYTFSFPSFHDHGWHFSTVCQWVFNKQLTALVKFSHTQYFNRPTISSATELINASHREDIAFQLRWKL